MQIDQPAALDGTLPGDVGFDPLALTSFWADVSCNVKFFMSYLVVVESLSSIPIAFMTLSYTSVLFMFAVLYNCRKIGVNKLSLISGLNQLQEPQLKLLNG